MSVGPRPTILFFMPCIVLRTIRALALQSQLFLVSCKQLTGACPRVAGSSTYFHSSLHALYRVNAIRALALHSQLFLVTPFRCYGRWSPQSGAQLYYTLISAVMPSNSLLASRIGLITSDKYSSTCSLERPT